VDLSVELDSVLGLNDTRLRQVRLKLQKRNDLVAAVDFRGMLDSGKPAVAVLTPEPGRPRVLRLETADAGQLLKLIGIYQNMVGGTGTLTLNLDGRGAAERQGQVTVTNFRVLGDTIASEVFQTPDDSKPLIAQQPRPDTRRVLREQFDFEELFAQFSVGSGQLAIDNALARGPLIGVSLRGKVDFRSRRVELGGTYVPLSGLSRAFSEIPLLGLVLTGPNGEGVLGITFLVKGAMANPQVTVNPFSPLTLGLLREFMQMAPENVTITPNAEPKKAPPSAKAGPQLRSSPPAAAQPGASGLRTPEVLDGWTATSKQTPKK
jgi:AsmA-like C-terminal region